MQSLTFSQDTHRNTVVLILPLVRSYQLTSELPIQSSRPMPVTRNLPSLKLFSIIQSMYVTTACNEYNSTHNFSLSVYIYNTNATYRHIIHIYLCTFTIYVKDNARWFSARESNPTPLILYLYLYSLCFEL